jgi:hypothetical protein
VPLFKAAFPYQHDVLGLPVVDIDATSCWYSNAFGLMEVERLFGERPTVILARDGVKIGFSINGCDAALSETIRSLDLLTDRHWNTP